VLSYSESDLDSAMAREEPDLKAAAFFALMCGEAREALGEHEAALQLFQQAINIARVALDPMGEVLAFDSLLVAVTRSECRRVLTCADVCRCRHSISWWLP